MFKKKLGHQRKPFLLILCGVWMLVFIATMSSSLFDRTKQNGPPGDLRKVGFSSDHASTALNDKLRGNRFTNGSQKDSLNTAKCDKKEPNEPFKHACIDYNSWNEIVSDNLKPVWSTMKMSKDQDKTGCPYFNVSEKEYYKLRLKFSLECKQGNDVLATLTWANDTGDIFAVPFGDKCVSSFIERCCTGENRIPNVVHYVWYSKGELTFSAFTSILSVIRFIKPCLIIFHGDKLPYGNYWDYIVNLSPFILHMKSIPLESPFGIKLAHKEHVGDVLRIKALIIYGGIYIDTDQLIVKSVESYRKYRTFMSYLNNGLMGCFFIMAERNATFLHLWLDGYRYHYNGSYYVYNCMVYPKKIAVEHKDLIHLEYGTNSRPMDLNDVDLYDSKYANYNWSSIYGIHLFIRIMSEPYNEFTIRKTNNIVGSISRYIIYGVKELC